MSLRADARLSLRLLSPRPSLLTPTSDTRANVSPQKPLDLKQLKQRAAAIPPIVSAPAPPLAPQDSCQARPQPPCPPHPSPLLPEGSRSGRAHSPGGRGAAPAASLFPALPSSLVFPGEIPMEMRRERLQGAGRRAGWGSGGTRELAACWSPFCPPSLVPLGPSLPWLSGLSCAGGPEGCSSSLWLQDHL